MRILKLSASFGSLQNAELTLDEGLNVITAPNESGKSTWAAFLMAMLYGGQIQGMLPRLKSKNFEGLELIRPMYCITEEDVLRWRDGNGLDFIACACKFTENTASETTFSARKRVKELIAELKKEIPSVEDNIFQSSHNVQLDTLVRYKTEGAEVSFLRNFTE